MITLYFLPSDAKLQYISAAVLRTITAGVSHKKVASLVVRRLVELLFCGFPMSDDVKVMVHLCLFCDKQKEKFSSFLVHAPGENLDNRDGELDGMSVDTCNFS